MRKAWTIAPGWVLQESQRPEIPTLGRRRQENQEFKSATDTQRESLAALGKARVAAPGLKAVSDWAEGSHSGPRARGAGAKESQEIVGHWLFGGDATCLLGCSLEDDEIFLEVLIQF